MRAIITGAGHFVPEQRLTNADLEQMVDTNDEWIMSRTGIRERRILQKDRGLSYMAAKAAQMILDENGLSADEIDVIIVATSTPDMMIPSAAALVQEKLKASNCWGFDLNAGCTGFIYALATGSQFIEAGKYRKVMVIGGDKMSSILNYEDRNTCVIFGDGAGAVLLEPSEDETLGIRDFILRMDGSGHAYLNVPAGGSLLPASHETVEKKMHCVFQDGKTVFKHAVTGMAEVSAKLLEKNNLKSKDIKLLIPHQANIRIIDSVAKRLGLEPEQVIVNLQEYGNTTAGTIPLAMSEAYHKKMMVRGDRILISAFGAGFTWGSLLLVWAMD
jgi:3-oxoacyl-[acyl-carrier-protein] synthase III